MYKKVFPFITWLPIAKRSIPDDLIAGLTNTVIVIPQAVAFLVRVPLVFLPLPDYLLFMDSIQQWSLLLLPLYLDLLFT